jgi:hypothetical protein
MYPVKINGKMTTDHHVIKTEVRKLLDGEKFSEAEVLNQILGDGALDLAAEKRYTTTMKIRDLLEEKKFSEAEALNQTMDAPYRLKLFSDLDKAGLDLMNAIEGMGIAYAWLRKAIPENQSDETYLTLGQKLKETYNENFRTCLSLATEMGQILDDMIKKEVKSNSSFKDIFQYNLDGLKKDMEKHRKTSS